MELTGQHLAEFERDGFTIVRGAYTAAECDAFIDYMLDLQAGRTRVEGFAPRGPDDWDRLISRCCHHPMGLQWMIDPRLRQPLRALLGEEADGVQSMYLFKSSQQRRHQDAYHLPGCVSAWVALQDVGAHNGTLHVQAGSHRKTLLEKKDFREGPWQGWDPEDAFDALFARNALPEVAVAAQKGDAVFFHGGLIHRGGPILDPGSFRHSWAGHYIPRSYDPWPYEASPRLRVSFDGVCRFTPTR